MWQFNPQLRSRLCLIGLIAFFCAGVAVFGVGRQGAGANRSRPPTSSLRAVSWPSRLAAEHVAELRQLEAFDRRAPAGAEWARVLASVDHASWRVAGAAVRVVRAHQHPKRVEVESRLLERAVACRFESDAASDEFAQRIYCVRVVRWILEDVDAAQHNVPNALLVQILDSCPDGPSRGRALELAAGRPPADWHRVVMRALQDSSERVRMVAIDEVDKHRWFDAAPLVEELAGSPRPALRRRAEESLRRIGSQSKTLDYRDAALAAARAVADRIWNAGMNVRDASLSNDSSTSVAALREELALAAEDYLDLATGRPGEADDAPGVLLLAAAVRVGHVKLTLRLWEHDVARTDSDEEMIDRGLETIARNRLLAALEACRTGDATRALGELASLPNLARAASDRSLVQAYQFHASEMSTAIWRHAHPDSLARPSRRSREPSRGLVSFASELLDDLDFRKPADRGEFRRRLDAWCGLTPPAAAAPRRNVMAN